MNADEEMGRRFPVGRGPAGSGRRGEGAFTLIELLVATAVFMVLVLVLASISNQAVSTWSRSENKSDLREAARAAINVMGSELRQAVLPVSRGEQNGPQFVINPASVSDAFKNRDAVFWQAPIATSRSRGDLAVGGNFVRREGNLWKLCRLFVNPDDAEYALRGTGPWVDDGLLNSKAPGTEASNLQGVFLENVPGMWVKAYSDAVTPYASYDSRLAQRLPSRVEVSLALLDKAGAERVASGQVVLPEARNCADLATFLNQLPEAIRGNVQSVTVNVSFLF